MSEEPVGDSRATGNRIILTIAGFILAAPAGGAASLSLFTLAHGVFTGQLPNALAGLAVSIYFGLIGGAVIGGPVSLILGPPVYLMMKRYGLMHRFYFAALGCLLALVASVLLLAPNTALAVSAAAPILGLFALAGAIGGLVFWLIRRPDRDGRSDARSVSPGDYGA